MSAQKNQENQQFARVSASGVLPVAEQSADNQGREPLANPSGVLWFAGLPGPAPLFPTRNQLGFAAALGNVIRPINAGVASFVTSITGFVIKGQVDAYPLYIQLFDGVVAGPVRVCIPILGDNLAFSYSPGFESTAAGVSVGLSTTPTLYTAADVGSIYHTQGVYWTA